MGEEPSVDLANDNERWLFNGHESNTTSPLNSHFDTHAIFGQPNISNHDHPFHRQATFDLQHPPRLGTACYSQSSLELQNTVDLEQTYRLQDTSSLHTPRHRRNAIELPNDLDYKVYSACDTAVGTFNLTLITIPDDLQYPMVLSSPSSDTTTLSPGTTQSLQYECWVYPNCPCSTSQAFNGGSGNWFRNRGCQVKEAYVKCS
jgi:hypothetical protein